MNCLGNPPTAQKRASYAGHPVLSRSSLLYDLLLPAITILSLALLCFAYEATQKFGGRRGLF